MTATDPHETHARAEGFRKHADDEAWLAAMNEALATMPAPPRHSAASALPIVYVVGAPRSGTTLLAQLLITAFRVGYVSNLIARFYRRPSAGVALQRMLAPCGDAGPQGLASVHGVTEGPFGQHEFGYFWRHWLGLDAQPTHHLTPDAAARVDRDGLRAALEDELLAGFGLPLLLKNIICGLHAPLLCALHPASLFIHVERPEEDVVRSILAVRRARYGDYRAWWSIKPSSWPFADSAGDPAAEVQRQVRDTKAEIRSAIAACGAPVVELRYEHLCDEPRAAMRRVAAAVEELGATLAPRREVPAQLTARPGPRLDPEQERALARVLSPMTTPKRPRAPQ